MPTQKKEKKETKKNSPGYLKTISFALLRLALPVGRIGGAGSSLEGAASQRASQRIAHSIHFPDELLEKLFEFLETEDVLCLADAELNSELGRVATEARSLIRVRRAIISSTDWLTHADLGSLVAAFIEADAVIAYQVNLRVAEHLSRNTGQDERTAEVQ